MKITIHSAYKKQWLSLVIFVILSSAIWFIGPLLAIANHVPFAHPEKRIYIIAALWLIWILKFIFFDIVTPAKPALPGETTKKLEALCGKFEGAIEFLKKAVVSKQNGDVSLINLPWYLLIGPANTGKTSLLAHSNINFILSKRGETNVSPHGCDWWVTRDSVLVDVPSSYFMGRDRSAGKSQEANRAANLLWNTLLKLIKAHQPLAGAVITLNIPELIRKTGNQHKTLLIHNLKNRITELRTQFGNSLPFYVVITKCDLIPGFLDFFSESGSDELTQSWGLTLPALQPKDKLLDIVTARFNILIKRINKQLIWRLHQERNPNARPFIKDFPLHLERVKDAFVTLLKTLSMPDLRLQGVYFTSAIQHAVEESPGNAAHQALQIMRNPPMPSRAYFIKQLLLQSLLYAPNTAEVTNAVDYKWQRRATYAASIGIIVTAGLLLGNDFQQGVQKTYALQNGLERYQLYIQQGDSSDDRLIKALPLLDALQQAANQPTHQWTHLENVLSFYSNRSQQTATEIYHQALQTIVIPEIKNDLEGYLRNANNRNPVLVYTALKAYLMLTDENNREADFIANTLNKINTSPMNSNAAQQLTDHIAAAFTRRINVTALDQALIAEVRKQLANLPSNELGFVILKNMDNNNADSTISLGTNQGNPPVFVSKQVSNRIPNMFTAANFQKIVSEQISQAAAEAVKGNWVLGEITPTVNQPSADALITQLRSQYVSNYVDIWESQLANIQPYTPKNLLQADEVVQNLTNNNSPLLQLLQTIKQNTSIDDIYAASPKIQSLNNLTIAPNTKEGSLYQIFVSLQQLHNYLQTILTASNAHKAAFAAAADRMKDTNQDPITTIHLLAEQYPEPLKSWLNTIASQSWNFMLQAAGQYVDNAWRKDILPTYNQNIANRYPFAQKSNKEINLQHFTDFMGHRGALANFYVTYLKPFVNDTGEQWTWRTVDDQRMPFSNKLLTTLQQASAIQQAFFPNGDNKLAVEFTLQPVALDPAMRSLTLNINGQQSVFQKNGRRLPKTFTWPGNYYSHDTTISFITPRKQLISNTMKGDWGLFRMVNNALENVNEHKTLLLNITANGHSAKYMLFTDGHANPFLSMNMARFELPQDIFS